MTAPHPSATAHGQPPWAREYRHEDLGPGLVTWFALAADVYADDRDAGIDMLVNYLAGVMVKARAAATSEGGESRG